MICRGIIFEKDGLRILCHPHSDVKDVQDRVVEDLWNAREVLGRLVVYKWPEVPPMWVGTDVTKTWQNYLMYLLTPVARHYDVSKDKLLSGFVRHFMPSILLSGKHTVPEGSDRLAFQMMDSMGTRSDDGNTNDRQDEKS